MPISLLIADEHEIVHQGLRAVLQGSEVHVVATATSIPEALKATTKHAPDVVLLDVRFDGDGLHALKLLRQNRPGIAVIMLSAFDNPSYVARAVAWGASDYLLRDVRRTQLLSSIRRAAQGKPAAAGSVLHNVRESLSRQRDGLPREVPLTNRETQVARHLAHGLSNRDIAAALKISTETVKEHVQHIFGKANVRHRTQVAVWAVKQGLA